MSESVDIKNKIKSKFNKDGRLKGYGVPNCLVNYYLVLMFTVFPLFASNSFSNIRHDKYNVFLLLSGVLIVSELIVFIFSYFERKRENIIPEKKWYKTLSVTDWAFGALMLLYVISTVFSEYKLDSVTGEIGRNTGLIFFAVVFLVYIAVSRNYIAKDYVFFFIAGGCLAVYILDILNFYYIDPLDMFRGYGDTVINDFTSTIGNKNIMSAFCCLTIPLFILMYMNTDNKPLKYTCLFAGGVGFPAMLCADSESGFLGLVPFMAVILLYYSRNVTMLRRFFTAVAAMLLCAKLLKLFTFVMELLKSFSIIFGEIEKGFGTMQNTFIYDNKSFILIFLTAGIAAGLYYLENKKGKSELPKTVPYVLVAVYVLAVTVFLGLFVRFSFIDTRSKLGGVMTFFRFDEKWGTHRGFMWIKAWEIFRTSGVKNALIGFGPDTFFHAFTPYFTELREKFNNSATNCAHNEYLNYLITTGALGLAAYVTLFASGIKRAFEAAKENYLAIVFIAPVICYLLQSVVNIANPEVTPLLFIYLALSESIVRKVKS